MNPLILKRRKLLRLSFLASFGMLASCGIDKSKAVLMTSKETFPKEFLAALPSAWRYEFFKSQFYGENFERFSLEDIDMLAIGDGWIHKFPFEKFKPIGAHELFSRMEGSVENFMYGLGSDFSSRVFPIGFSPWVMVFRNGEPWLNQALEGWEVLLDNRLEKQIILPNSPRLIISLASKMRDPNALTILRKQAKTYDDRNGLNWILSNKASVAVLPLQRCMKSIRKDPRLKIVLPKAGSPLNWTLLLIPKSSRQSLPVKWIKGVWDTPFLSKSLASGFIPPFAISKICKDNLNISRDFQSIVCGEESLWGKCWSLPILSDTQRILYREIWNKSAP